MPAKPRAGDPAQVARLAAAPALAAGRCMVNRAAETTRVGGSVIAGKSAVCWLAVGLLRPGLLELPNHRILAPRFFEGLDDTLKIPHQWHEWSGDHSANYWCAHLADYLHFYDASLATHDMAMPTGTHLV